MSLLFCKLLNQIAFLSKLRFIKKRKKETEKQKDKKTIVDSATKRDVFL